MAVVLGGDLYLVFLQGTERYALGLDGVDEVLDPVPLGFVPWAPSQCMGVFPHQGRILAVVDAGALLALEQGGGPPAGPTEGAALTRFVVVGYGDYRFALRVDRVERISPLVGWVASQRGEVSEGERWLDEVCSEPEGMINKINTAALVETVDRIFQG